MAVIDKALTTLADVKSYLGLTANTHDALLEMLINQMTVFVEMECGNRTFKYDEDADPIEEIVDGDYDGTKRNKIFLKTWPIVEIVSIEVNDGDYNNPTWSAVAGTDYTLNPSSGTIYMSSGLNKGNQNYKIVYKGGFADIPLDLQLCCIKIVAKEFDKRRSQGILNEGLGGGSASWNENIDPSAQRIFRKYRNFF